MDELTWVMFRYDMLKAFIGIVLGVIAFGAMALFWLAQEYIEHKRKEREQVELENRDRVLDH